MLNSNERVSFATIVIAAIALIGSSLTERVGTRKVFISEIYRVVASSGFDVGSIENFKALLVAAHRAGHLSLARANFVAAMDPAVVAASETVTDCASFHFVIDPSAMEPWEVAA